MGSISRPNALSGAREPVPYSYQSSGVWARSQVRKRGVCVIRPGKKKPRARRGEGSGERFRSRKQRGQDRLAQLRVVRPCRVGLAGFDSLV